MKNKHQCSKVFYQVQQFPNDHTDLLQSEPQHTGNWTNGRPPMDIRTGHSTGPFHEHEL